MRDVSLVNNRLTNFDINYDISYMFITSIDTINERSTLINSISGTTLKRYDPSALIYNLGSQSILPYYTHHIKYFPVALSVAPFDINYKILSVTVNNYGPQITFPPNNADLNHQSYTTLTDASLIFGVSSISIYDVFYYYNYFTSISYSGTNFKVILDNSLNVNDPKSGTYDIIYESTDRNNVDVSLIRRLIVGDGQAPFIRTICGDNIYELSNNTWTVNYDNPYIEYVTWSGKANTNTMKTLAVIDKYGFYRYCDPLVPGRSNDRDVWTSCDLYMNAGKYFSAGELLASDGGFRGDGPMLISFDNLDTDEIAQLAVGPRSSTFIMVAT
jgi:hypothetical protein